ncbi:MAG: hypothetical protein ACPLKS_07690 [Caldisericum exile]|uniref:hypothetical protein n=1 Tax=Caldisericum exile TaxID=693075 RepID=UPI003C7246D7
MSDNLKELIALLGEHKPMKYAPIELNGKNNLIIGIKEKNRYYYTVLYQFYRKNENDKWHYNSIGFNLYQIEKTIDMLNMAKDEIKKLISEGKTKPKKFELTRFMKDGEKIE